ncbi:hypothetical protein VPHD148_0274 [Vibrio phage D148]
MHMTPEGLKKMAATNVAALKMGTSLNDSITKVAMENELNSDQVKRLVETTNQMAYLSELEGHDDRTFEFDVANYDDVMDSIISDPTLEKAASTSALNPMDLVAASFNSMEKVATEKEATMEKWGKPQKLQALKKVASQQRNRLDELTNAEHDNMVKLAQHRAIVSRDPEALEKMAKFDNQLEMTRLVFGHDKVASEVRRVWAPEALRDVKACSDRLNIIKQAQEEISELKPKVEQAEGILKEAFVSAAINAVGRSGIGQAAKNLTNKAPKMGGKMKRKATKAYGAFDAASSTADVSKGTNRNFDAWSSLRG